MLPFSQHLYDTLVSQADNSKVHWTRRICDWFHEQSYTLLRLDWLGRSIDNFHWKSLEHLGTAGKTLKSASPQFVEFAL